MSPPSWTHPEPDAAPPEVEALEPEILDGPPPPREYSIDALAAATGVPSRTIRFYQSKGALQKPEIRGRKAIYRDSHVERLDLIGQLQDRGLRIKAIRELVGRIDRGELVLGEWLGLQDSLVAPWTDARPRLLDEAELHELTGELPPGRLAALVRHGLLERKGVQFLCGDVARLKGVLQLEAAGVSLDLSAAIIERTRKRTGKLARDLTGLFEDEAGDGFGGSDAASIQAALAAWRDHGPALVQGIFAEQMQAVLRQVVASGKGSKLQG